MAETSFGLFAFFQDVHREQRDNGSVGERAHPSGYDRAFDMATAFVQIIRDGGARVVSWPWGAHPNLDGVVIGAVEIPSDAPHGGEMHPDGDELSYLVSGRLEVILDGQREAVVVEAGQAFVIPRDTWHRVHVVERANFVHVTPGPNSRTRPRTLEGAAP